MQRYEHEQFLPRHKMVTEHCYHFRGVMLLKMYESRPLSVPNDFSAFVIHKKRYSAPLRRGWETDCQEGHFISWAEQGGLPRRIFFSVAERARGAGGGGGENNRRREMGNTTDRTDRDLFSKLSILFNFQPPLL